VNPCFRAYSSINCNTPFNICFVRHGQSTWNRDNRFIGWTDTPLTEDGVLEARVAGRMLQTSGILFDEAHTVSIGVLYCLKTEELPAIRSFR
jgi:bisphosphoglycerate-dependent phosphoglycerate mutase